MQRYTVYTPTPALLPYVQQLAVSEQQQPHSYNVLPDTSVVLGFQYNGSLVRGSGSAQVALSHMGISGLMHEASRFGSPGGAGTVLVYLKPGRTGAFFSVPAHHLYNQSLPLHQIIPASQLHRLEDNLLAATADSGRIAAVEHFLLERLSGWQPDPLAEAAIAAIVQAGGNIRMAHLASLLHTSASPLEKRFRQAAGTSAKRFASIVRMQALLRQAGGTVPLEELAHCQGFYDQAHFIKAFRHFTGSTPRQYLK